MRAFPARVSMFLHVMICRWLNDMQSLRCAAEVDATECERLRCALQKQEEHQMQQQQQFAQTLEALERENRELRGQQVTTRHKSSLTCCSSYSCRQEGTRCRSPATCASSRMKTSSCSRLLLRYSRNCKGNLIFIHNARAITASSHPKTTSLLAAMLFSYSVATAGRGSPVTVQRARRCRPVAPRSKAF